jgi:soluble lytic murein transglycosylase
MEAIATQEISAEFKARLLLKQGQAQFRQRRFADAEQTLRLVDEAALKKEQRDELAYWRGRSLERNGKNNDAYGAYLRLATDSPASELADNAIFDAATIMKQQGKTAEAGQLFSRITQYYPDSTLLSRASWEAGWERLSAGDAKGATEHFSRLASATDSRERGLYWLAKALEAGGEKDLALEERGRLMKEFPFGYYALLIRKDTGQPTPLPSISPLDLATELPIPQGNERIKAMITLGLDEEARQELARLKVKAGTKPSVQRGIARLYLEMDDYAAAMRLFQRQGAKGATETPSTWGITYPLPYRTEVKLHAEQNKLSRELVYAVIRAESSFSPGVVSPAGAIGLMQLMPSTAHQMKPESSLKNVTSRLILPDYNISLGTRHLRDLLNKYNGNEILAIAAYNAGASNVDRWLKTYGTLPQEAFIEQIPFAETREYVKKVLTNAHIYLNLYRNGPMAPTPQPQSADTPPTLPLPTPAVEMETLEKKPSSTSPPSTRGDTSPT